VEPASNRESSLFLGGQIAYVAHIGESIKTSVSKPDARLRVIYDNGTESDLLLRSLQRALYKDEAVAELPTLPWGHCSPTWQMMKRRRSEIEEHEPQRLTFLGCSGRR
jgi:hypothetical protein